MTYNVVTESNLRSIQELLGIQKDRGKLLEPSEMIKVGIPVIAISRVKKLVDLSVSSPTLDYCFKALP